MKTSQILVIIAFVIIIGILAFSWNKKSSTRNLVVSQPDSILGCYAAITGNDVYKLNIESQTGVNVAGTLEFKNYQKDSSSGMFTGIYQDGILLGDYAFRSEGTDSVIQVVFKKIGDNFIRGYGPMDASGTQFVDVDTVTYNNASPLAVFKKGACPAPASVVQITFPKGGENLIAGDTYTLTWTGGPAETQIFLINTELKSQGASVSVSDRIYGVKNTGTYQYRIPQNIAFGTYEIQIGNSTSNTFKIVSE
jgi:hypothetical protein